MGRIIVAIAGAVLTLGLIINFLIIKKLLTGKVPVPRMIRELTLRPWNMSSALLILFIFSVSIIHIRLVALRLIPLFIVILVMKSRNLSLKSAFGVRWKRTGRNIAQAICFYIACLPHVVLAGLLTAVTVLALGYELEAQPIVNVFLGNDLNVWQITALCFTGIVLAPILEELFFRGVIMPAFCRKLGFAQGLIIVSILFSAMHLHAQSFLPLFVLSLALGISYAATGSLVTPIVMHMLFNGISMTIMLLQRVIIS